MPKMVVVSGADVVKIFEKFGFLLIKQRGSHMKLCRIINGVIRQILTIPNHDEIDKGTLRGIINEASRYIPEDELKKIFYR